MLDDLVDDIEEISGKLMNVFLSPLDEWTAAQCVQRLQQKHEYITRGSADIAPAESVTDHGGRRV